MIVLLGWVSFILSTMYAERHKLALCANRRYATLRYGECRYAECRGA
jgi:hypothetical protein